MLKCIVVHHMYEGTHTGYALELELQAIVPSCVMCVPGAESGLWELNSCPLGEQQVLVTTEPSVSPLSSVPLKDVKVGAIIRRMVRGYT